MSTKGSPIKAWLIRLGLVSAVLVGSAAVVYVVRRPPPPSAAPAIQARLELSSGDVRVDRGRGEERGTNGMALLSDASLTTGAGARALVRLPDGATVFLRGDSQVKLGDGQVDLARGEYWLSAPPSDRRALTHQLGEVSVSAAEAGVSLRRDGELTVVYVAAGMATVTSPGGRVEVNAGEQATVKGASAPEVAPLGFWDDWTGGMADYAGKGRAGVGGGTIYGVDVGAPLGSQARKLEISKQAVRAVVRGGLAETEVDQTFFNPGGRDVEGWYWFTLPASASVTGFAVETDGSLVEGEFQERREAQAGYSAARSSGHAPALLEWVNQSTYRARIFPVKSGQTRRVVLRYLELRPVVGDLLEYLYPMGRGEPVRIGEFSLTVDLGEAGEKMKIATLADARLEEKGRRVTMRRSGFTPRADFQLEASFKEDRPPLRIARYKARGETADYLLARYTPDIDWSTAEAPPAEVVVVVDTSAAGDEASRQLKAQTAEAVLRAMSDKDRFALVSVDVRTTVLHPKEGLASATEGEIAAALAALAEHSSGGATDLASSFDVSLKRLHGAAQPAVVYLGDGVATSGELTGEQLIERLRRALSTSRARLFTVAVGPESDHALLGELARAGGGERFTVEETDHTTTEALALLSSVKRPTLTDFEMDLGAGLDEPFVSNSGKVSQGQEVVLLARTHHELPSEVKVRGQLAGKPFEKSYPVKVDDSVIQAFVPRLWAAEYVRRLLGSAQGAEAERGRISSLGLEYGLMTPFTSILALESEAAYSRMGIQRRSSPLRGVRLGALSREAEWRLTKTLGAPTVPEVALGCSQIERTLSKDEAPVGAAAPPAEYDKGGEQQSGVVSSMADQEGESGDQPSPVAPAPAYEPAPELEESKPGDLGALGGGSIGHSGRGYGNAPGGLARPAPQRAYALEKNRKESGALAAPNPAPSMDSFDPAMPSIRPPDVYLVRTCSDAAERPLAERMLLWRRRLATVSTASDLIDRYRSAYEGCELKDWRSERAFLELMQARVSTPEAAVSMLRLFTGRPDVQKFVAKLLLRRSVDSALRLAVERELFGSKVTWADVDRELSEIKDLDKRIARLRAFMAQAPEDPNGDIRLVKLLSESGKKDEALAHGRRLRDRGFMTPDIARRLGDVLARAKLDAEAVRTYSEIVEFDPANPASRGLLGDIYLARGWYEPAYRQYRTLGELQPNSPIADLRLAAAAAGSGRTDEALRIQRQVASAEGTPGPKDPRQWAKLLSAAGFARLLAEPPADPPGQPPTDPERRKANLERKLKELQLFSGEGTLVILTWEDLAARVNLLTFEGDVLAHVGDVNHAVEVGLSAALVPNSDYERLRYTAQLMSDLSDDPIALVRSDIRWDGQRFTVKVTRGAIAAGEQRHAW
ncbi:MAG: FecR domain-containing protein [Polyangiaceae bacterium]|nr:FecR domain-containing protein [Polyangiaceae bacterium]